MQDTLVFETTSAEENEIILDRLLESRSESTTSLEQQVYALVERAIQRLRGDTSQLDEIQIPQYGYALREASQDLDSQVLRLVRGDARAGEPQLNARIFSEEAQLRLLDLAVKDETFGTYLETVVEGVESSLLAGQAQKYDEIKKFFQDNLSKLEDDVEISDGLECLRARTTSFLADCVISTLEISFGKGQIPLCVLTIFTREQAVRECLSIFQAVDQMFENAKTAAISHVRVGGMLRQADEQQQEQNEIWFAMFTTQVINILNSSDQPSEELAQKKEFSEAMELLVEVLVRSSNATLLKSRPGDVRDLARQLLRKSFIRQAPNNEGFIANIEATLNRWTKYEALESAIESLVKEKVRLLKQRLFCLYPGEKEDFLVLPLLKLVYSHLHNFGKHYETVGLINRPMGRTLIQGFLHSWYHNQIKEGIVLGELDRLQVQLFDQEVMLEQDFLRDNTSGGECVHDIQGFLSQNFNEEDYAEIMTRTSLKVGNSGMPSPLHAIQPSKESEERLRVLEAQTRKQAGRANAILKDLKKKLGKLPMLKLKRIYTPEDKQATHVIIAISGFLSQDDTHYKEWQGLINHVKATQQKAAVFAVSWEAATKKSFGLICGMAVANSALVAIVIWCLGSFIARAAASPLIAEARATAAIFSQNYLLSLSKQAGSVGAFLEEAFSTALTLARSVASTLGRFLPEGIFTKIFSVMPTFKIPLTFEAHRQLSKVTGKMLALALALRQPFKYQTVSLVGFSLGSQVSKSCISTLAKIYHGKISKAGVPEHKILMPCDIVQNVTLMAGAVMFRDSSKQRWKFIIERMIGGQMKNVFSRGDKVIEYFYQPIQQFPKWGQTTEENFYREDGDYKIVKCVKTALKGGISAIFGTTSRNYFREKGVAAGRHFLTIEGDDGQYLILNLDISYEIALDAMGSSTERPGHGSFQKAVAQELICKNCEIH